MRSRLHIIGQFFYRKNITQSHKIHVFKLASQNIGKTRAHDASNASNMGHFGNVKHCVIILHMANNQCQMFNVGIKTYSTSFRSLCPESKKWFQYCKQCILTFASRLNDASGTYILIVKILLGSEI